MYISKYQRAKYHKYSIKALIIILFIYIIQFFIPLEPYSRVNRVSFCNGKNCVIQEYKSIKLTKVVSYDIATKVQYSICSVVSPRICYVRKIN